MHIGVLTTSFPRFEGDYAGSFIKVLLRSLSKDNFNFTVLTPSDLVHQNEIIEREIRVKRFNYFLPQKLQRLTYNFGMPDNIRKSLLAILQIPTFLFFYLCHSIVLSVKSDILWSHWIIPSGIFGAIIKRVTNKKHILTMHSPGELHLSIPFPFKKRIISFVINNSDVVVTVSRDLQNKVFKSLPSNFQEKAKHKFHVIPMGVNVRRQQISNDKLLLRKEYGINTKNLILFIGRLEIIKGVHYLIKAMQLIDDVTLIIAGEGQQKEKLMKLANDSGGRLRFVGLVKGEVKSNYFTMCDAVVIPSITLDFEITEGVPVVILEAFAHARPVLASKSGGIPEVVDDGYNGYLFEEKNPLSLAETVNKLFNNREKLEQMSVNAYNSAKRFDVHNIAKKYEKIISQI